MFKAVAYLEMSFGPASRHPHLPASHASGSFIPQQSKAERRFSPPSEAAARRTCCCCWSCSGGMRTGTAPAGVSAGLCSERARCAPLRSTAAAARQAHSPSRSPALPAVRRAACIPAWIPIKSRSGLSDARGALAALVCGNKTAARSSRTPARGGSAPGLSAGGVPSPGVLCAHGFYRPASGFCTSTTLPTAFNYPQWY